MVTYATGSVYDGVPLKATFLCKPVAATVRESDMRQTKTERTGCSWPFFKLKKEIHCGDWGRHT